MSTIFKKISLVCVMSLGAVACVVTTPSGNGQGKPEISSLGLGATKNLINSLPAEAPIYYAEGVGPPCVYQKDSDAAYRITESSREFSEGASATLKCPTVSVHAPGGSPSSRPRKTISAPSSDDLPTTTSRVNQPQKKVMVQPSTEKRGQPWSPVVPGLNP